MSNEINIKIEISDIKAREVLTTACEAGSYGIGYWADITDVVYSPCKGAGNMVETMTVEPAEDDTDFPSQNITVTTVRNGFLNLLGGRLASNEHTGRALAYLHAAYVDADMDGPLADTIIQAGLFGELRYG